MDKNEYINGYKQVKSKNGVYFIRELDGRILPYYFDAASNFNEYGLAMVQKNGSFSWINGQLQYLTKDGVWKVLRQGEQLNGWSIITPFQNGSLSKLTSKGPVQKVCFFNTLGMIQKFTSYSNPQISYDTFIRSTDFDQDGIALADDKILFSEGYYISQNDAIIMMRQEGFLKEIYTKIKKKG